MNQYLNKKIFSIIAETAAVEKVEAYVIGGFVRDCLLQRKCKDIDIVVTQSGIDLARKVAAKIGSKTKVDMELWESMP